MPDAARTVIQQKHALVNAYTTNVGVLENAARMSTKLQMALVIRAAQERVSTDLIRLRSTIGPSDPTPAELSGESAPWTQSLRTEVDKLKARLEVGAMDERLAIALALADEAPATIDLAIATPGFAAARVLQDACTLDRLNAQILDEPVEQARAALHARRDALLNAYLPAREARTLADELERVVEVFIATTHEQGQMLGVHAGALNTWAARPGVSEPIIGIFQDAQLRASVLAITEKTQGKQAAQTLSDRLTKADEAIKALGVLVDPAPKQK